MITIDFIFSYWIFLLFVVYLIYPTKYTNPFLLLCVALLEQTSSFIYYIYKGISFFILFIYLLLIISIKVIPLYLLRNSKNKFNPIFSILFFLIYLLYLKYYGTNFLQIYKQVNTSMIKGTNDTPFFYYLNNINPSHNK